MIGGEIRVEGKVEETEILGLGQRRQALQRRGEIARLVENAHFAGQSQDQKDISVRQKSEAVGHVHIVEQHCDVEGCGPMIRRAGDEGLDFFQRQLINHQPCSDTAG